MTPRFLSTARLYLTLTDEWQSGTELATKMCVSKSTVEQQIAYLNSALLSRGKTGAGGGYRRTMYPEPTVGMVLDAVGHSTSHYTEAFLAQPISLIVKTPN